MLFDGSVAEDRRSATRDAQGELTQAPGRGVKEPRSEGRTKTLLPGGRPDEIQRERNAPIPNIQWDPASGAFPVSVDEFESIARKALVNALSTTTNELMELSEIRFGTYFPIFTLQAQGYDISQHRNHWILTLKYFGNGKSYEVYMLLDKSVIQILEF